MIEIVTSPPALPPRPAEGHKGLFGRILVVGGDEAMLGAPVLAATSALRMGAGWVQLAVPRKLLFHALTITPELVGLPLDAKSAKKILLEAAKKADALVIGPGIGQSNEAAQRLKALLGLEHPVVIDADALNLLAREKRWPKIKAKALLTPHPGEMGRLLKLLPKASLKSIGTNAPDALGKDQAIRKAVAVEAANTFGATIVLKGHRTVVTDGTKVYVNETGDSSLSKAGTGDVLSGMIGCLLGQKMTPFDAACLGVYLHGRAGEIAGHRVGKRSALARDVIDALAQAITEHEHLRAV